MARHIFTFVRGVSAGQRWQPMQESRRRRQPSHHSPPSSNPSEPDPGSYSIPIDPEPQGWLNRTDAARRAFLAEE
ncbi:hypothetical protein N0V84_006813 [Fusarium piperis]|uniref:Uncharacterized protein n=1 Tax=Fusarium piperis TaxID=1435070 RepID=A0A9W9BMG9_9HYPO|nr:hypothetical protein N0V84_006813 [Fusarium piperis]